MKNYSIIIVLLLISGNIFSQNGDLILDKTWEIQEYYTETVNGKSIFFDIHPNSQDNINDLSESVYKFNSNGEYEAIVKNEINTTGLWNLSMNLDSLEMDTYKYAVTLLTNDSLILKNSGNKYGLVTETFLKLKRVEVLSISIEDISETSIDVYPNPTKDKIHFRFKETPKNIDNINIYSIQGKKIISIPFDEKKSQTISLKRLPQGVYFMKISDQVSAKKIIKL